MNVTLERRAVIFPSKQIRQRNKQLTICPSCKDVRYKDIWYSADSRLALTVDSRKDKISYHTCPACEMQNNGLYEGVLYLKNIPEKIYDQVISTVIHEAIVDYTDNPQHRLLDFFDVEGGYKVTATSAAMVHRIGIKLKSEFSSCEVYSTYQPYPFSLQITKIVFIDQYYL